MTDLNDTTAPTDRPQAWWTPNDLHTEPYPARSQLAAEAADHGMEEAVAGLMRSGWSDVAEAAIERAQATHGTDPTEWSRLQIGRNLLSAALATLVPVDGTTAAGWVARSISTHGITAPPSTAAGAALAVGGAIWLGRHAPGPLGALCGIGWSLLSAAVMRLWRFVRSPRGWILTRPLIWATASGVLIVSGRVIVHTLTGA